MSLILISSVEIKAQTETYTWNNVAIGGGGFVSGIITSKTEQNLMYSRTDVGGAYRWDAASGKWIPLLDWVSENELGYLGVESIAIDPVETNKVYMLVGTSYFNNGKTAILRSSDYGNTFSITDVTSQFKAHGNGMGRQTGEKLQVDPNSTNILFCGTRSNGLFKSTTSGGTWSKITSLTVPATTNGSNGISFVVLDPSTGTSGNATQTIIAGISQTGTNLYRSDDGGTTFTAISGAPTTLMPHRAVLASNRNLYITYTNNAGPWDITGAGAIWKYNLTSGVWTNVTPSGFSGAFGGISVDPNNASRLVASSLNTYQLQDNSYGDRIFLSTNGGTSWVDVVARGFDLDPNGSPWIDGHSIHWAGSIEFDPFNTKKVLVISGNGIFQTDDIDATVNVWKFQVNGLEETVPLDIVSIANGPVVSAIGDYDGFRHTDVAQYATIHTPRMGTTTSIAFAAQNPKIMIRIGSKDVSGVRVGVMYRSSDMGVSWTACTAKGPSGNLSISADGKVFLHTPENSSTTYLSIDNGAVWTTVTGLSVAGARTVADPVNPSKFYAYNSGNGSLLVSTNGGVSFSASGSPGSNGSKIIRLAPNKEGDVWVPLNNGGLTRSTNSGQAFSKLAGVTTCNAIGFGKEAPGKTFPSIYIYGTVGGILGIHRSTDEGATWLRVNNDGHEYGGPANGQFVMGDMNVYGRVYMSTAGRGIVYGESSETCIPTLVVPNIKVDDETPEQTSIDGVDQGETVLFTPQPDSPGSWSWKGPNDFTSINREVSLTNIQANQGGIYSVQFTNEEGCQSAWQTFTITVVVKVNGITVKGEGNATTIDETSGTLQLIAELSPANATDQSITWSIVSGVNVATVSTSGLLTALSNGVVTVKATANDGSGSFDEIEITVTNQTITAIEKSIDSIFGIYPNPVSSEIHIQNSTSVKQVIIYDMKGRRIKSYENDQPSMTIMVMELQKGMYIMTLSDSKNSTFTKRIIKY
ncbi:MAG: T9SS type A sorting domain-containing protein [Chryseolinea sp.]